MAWLRRSTVVVVCMVSLAAVGPLGRPAAGQNGPQTDWDSYKNRSFTPSVDQHLTDPVLVGAVDLHAHCDPDSYPRQWDAFDVARLAKERGLRAVVLKNHYTETAGLAFLVRKYGPPGTDVSG